MEPVYVRSAQRGVTLVELMVVMVILAIIAAIAIPTYRQQVIRSNRSDAKTALMQTAQTLERCFTRVSTYTGCVVLPVASPEGLYSVSAGEDDEDITGTTYLLTATPQNGQAEDEECQRLEVNEAGVRSAFDASDGNTTDECW